jgi:hypothetical protein
LTPINLYQCFESLDELLPKDFMEEIINGPENKLILHHHTLGRQIRNKWGLWTKSELYKYFNGLGIHHPDDMSSIILTSYWRVKNKKPINLDEQIKFHLDWWKNTIETDGI